MFLLQIWKYNGCILNSMIYITLGLLGKLNIWEWTEWTTKSSSYQWPKSSMVLEWIVLKTYIFYLCLMHKHLGMAVCICVNLNFFDIALQFLSILIFRSVFTFRRHSLKTNIYDGDAEHQRAMLSRLHNFIISHESIRGSFLCLRQWTGLELTGL